MAIAPEFPISDISTAYKPINVVKETPKITDRLRLITPIPPTDLEVTTTLAFMSAFSRIQMYIPLLAENALREAYRKYQEPIDPLRLPPKTISNP